MTKEELPDIRKSIEKLEKDEEERIKRMRELISQLDIKMQEGQSLLEIKKLKCLRCGYTWLPRLIDNKIQEPKLCPSCNSPFRNNL